MGRKISSFNSNIATIDRELTQTSYDVVKSVADNIEIITNLNDNTAAIIATEEQTLASQNAAKVSEDNAQSSEEDSIAAKIASENAQELSENARDASQSAKDDSQTAKTASETAQGLSETAQAASETAQGLSESAKDAAQTAKTDAETAETNAQTSETNSANAQIYSEEWANKAEDTLVSAAAGANQSDEYSSKHHAIKALTSETAALNSKNSANADAIQTALDRTATGNDRTEVTNQAASALALYDQFDDRYLGAKSSSPATDNDGDDLVIGALFFNSTESGMYVYSNAGWIPSSSAVALTEDTFTGNNSQTSFTLSVAPPSKFACFITVGGVSQSANNYSVSGNILNFSTAPPVSSIEVRILSSASANAPIDDSISTAKLQNEAVTLDKLSAEVVQTLSESGGAKGGGEDKVFYENSPTVNNNYTLNENAMSVGPISIANGKTVTVPTGARWVIL